MRLHHGLTVATLLLLTNTACDRQQPAPATSVSPVDHVVQSPAGTSKAVLEKTFHLKGTASFPFEVPPHAVRPHLHGIFESFVGQVHGASDDSANIDFLILNEEQETARLNNRPSEALLSVESSHSQSVNFDLPASMNQPAKYYLVFRDSDGGKGNRVVEASFRVDF